MLVSKIKDPCWVLLSLNHILLVGLYGAISFFDFQVEWGWGDFYGWLSDRPQRIWMTLTILSLLLLEIFVTTVFAVMRICQKDERMVGRIMMVSLLLTFIGGILVWRDLMMSYETYTFSTAVEVFYIVLNVVLSLMMFGEYMFLYIDKKLSKE